MNTNPVESPFSSAQWIWPQLSNWDLHNLYALFRKSFTLDVLPEKAPLYISADQAYRLYLNGEYVCGGPARGFQHRWPYDCVDVRPWLKTGGNVIAVRAYHPGYSNFQYVSQNYAGLIVSANWGEFSLATDNSWRSKRQPGISRDTVVSSLQLFSQEIIDLNKADSDWMQPEYDDSPWEDCTTSRVYDSMPWFTMEPRGIPMLDESVVEIGTVIGTAQGASATDYLTTRNPAVTRYEEGLAHTAISVSTSTLKFAAGPQGTWRSYLIDLGKLHVGTLLLEVEGAKGGEIVESHHYETLTPGTLTPDFVPDAHCRMAFSRRLVCRQGDNTHEFFHPYGYRYMVLTVRDNDAPLKVRHRLRNACYPLQKNGAFESSEADLNAIWETCAWTQRVCSLDAYVDTPWREQAQWWGDARVQAWNTFHLDGDTRLFKRGIGQIGEQTTPDGVTYGHAPTSAHSCILPDFTLIWMITLWDFYWQTGSTEAFAEQQATVEGALTYFEEHLCADTGLLHHDKRYWLFLDWTGLPRGRCSSVYSLWYLYALERVSKLYRLIGEKEKSAACAQKAKSLRDSLRNLLSPEGLMRDGFDSEGQVIETTSLHAQTLAIITGLAPEHESAMLDKRLLPYIREEYQPEVTPSAYWITYPYTVLAERGYSEEVLAHIRKRWNPMTKQGTTWEVFEPQRGHESFSHAWSAHPLFHLMQILGGVRQIQPKWDAITVQPAFVGTQADVTIPSPHGKIRSCWKRTGQQIEGELVVPEGVEARLLLPGADEVVVTGKYTYSLQLAAS